MGLLRVLLAVSVLLEHQPARWLPSLYPGHIAVEMFFIVSGFYMALILAEKYDASTRSGIIAFYASRFFRLWPIFIITTGLVGLLWLAITIHLGRPPTSMAPVEQWIGPVATALVWLSNLTMVGQDVLTWFHVLPASGARLTLQRGYELADGSIWMGLLAPISPAWSIGLEIWFYLLAPILACLASRWLIAIALASLALRWGMADAGLHTYRFFPCQLALFVLGVLAYRISRAGAFAKPHVGYGCAMLVAAGALLFGSPFGLAEHWKWVLFGLFGASMGALFNLTRWSAADRHIGELSYPIYITHVFVASALGLVLKQLGTTLGGEMLLLAVMPFSLLLYLVVDRPVTQWRARFAGARA